MLQLRGNKQKKNASGKFKVPTKARNDFQNNTEAEAKENYED